MSTRQDKQWFSTKVNDDMDALYGVALRLTGNGANAEDLVAETVIKAWANIGKLQDRRKWRPWIFRILRNGYISQCRKQSVRPREVPYEDQAADEADSVSAMLLEQPDEFVAWWADPEHEAINALLGEQIREAIQGLPEVFRVTIMLVNVEELSYDEAAVVLGVPSGTVRSRMKRGRTMLQKALWVQARDSGLLKRRPGIEAATGE